MATLNHESGLAFGRDDRTTLLNMAACCLVNERAFYGDTTGKVQLLIHRVATSHPEWTVKLAVFLREHLNLRSISQLVLAQVATVKEAQPLVARAFDRVATRPDDMIEIVSLLKDPCCGPGMGLPAVVRKAVAQQLNRLGEYHLLKYRKSRQFGLKHLVRLCHPKPKSSRESALFRYLMDRSTWHGMSESEQETLPVIAAWESLRHGDLLDTALLDCCVRAGLPWEIIVPRFGSRPEVWSRLVPHMPIMALIRNLRNLHDNGCLRRQSIRQHVRSRLTNPEIIQRSKQFPFRWLSAYRVMEQRDSAVARWLEEALECSIANLPRLPGLSVIACDLSGSMSCGSISARSEALPIDIASLFGAIVDRICDDNLLYVFGSDIAQLRPSENCGTLPRAMAITRINVGHATNAYKVLQALLASGKPVDRILFFTDMQIYGEGGWRPEEDMTLLLRRYREKISPKVRTYIFNLQPYKHFMTPADEYGVTIFSGWSEKLVQYIALESEGGFESMVDLVERLEL